MGQLLPLTVTDISNKTLTFGRPPALRSAQELFLGGLEKNVKEENYFSEVSKEFFYSSFLYLIASQAKNATGIQKCPPPPALVSKSGEWQREERSPESLPAQAGLWVGEHSSPPPGREGCVGGSPRAEGMSLPSCQGILSSTSAAIRVTLITRARLLGAGHVHTEPSRALWAQREGKSLGEKPSLNYGQIPKKST